MFPFNLSLQKIIYFFPDIFTCIHIIQYITPVIVITAKNKWNIKDMSTLFIQINFIIFYIHSFRFAQGTKRNENGLPERIFFFIILLIGNSVYYKSRGGEWAVRLTG